MTRSAVACCAILVCLAAGLAQADDDPAEEGFVSIFNGKNLDGWTLMGKAEGWQAQDGVLHSDGGKGGNWLRSEKEYGDYILKLDWRVSTGGNSGVFIRAAGEGAPWQTGYEIQISQPKQDNKHCTGALYGYAAVNQQPDETADVWHAFEIQCQGPRIRILSDGLELIDVDQTKLTAPNEPGYTDPKTKPTRGYIGLQDAHAAEGNYIEFRNVRIKELE